MFMGEYNHTIDTKGRLIIPSKFREELGEEFVVTKEMVEKKQLESPQGEVVQLPIKHKEKEDIA